MPRKAIKVLSVFGTRPEAIKMAPVIARLQEHSDIESRVCVTAQHREMLDQVLTIFDIRPDHDLNIMSQGQQLSQLTARVLVDMEKVLVEERPHWLLVQGDTTTVMAAALAAFYQGIRIGHVEAGLRTHNKRLPYPEEINRCIADLLSDLYFAPTAQARSNLINEGLPEANIIVTGNTIVDALQEVLANLPDCSQTLQQLLPSGWQCFILVTAHRRENHGKPLEHICRALRTLAARYSPDLHILFPVHPNPNVWGPVHELLGDTPGITLSEPLDYPTFVCLMNHAYLILTDSGGVQEEAATIGKPVLVLREETERIEALAAGTVQLVGRDENEITEHVERLLNDETLYQRMSQKSLVYGDGKASERIVQALLTRSEL